MVFPGDVSDKVLEEDVIKKSREFFPTFMEWVADGNAEQILDAGSRLVIGAGVIYRVPANKTFFLTNAHLSSDVVAGGAGSSEVNLYFRNTKVQNKLISHHHDMVRPDHATSSINFPMPLKLDAGEEVIIVNDHAAFRSIANIQGFLLPKKISIR